MGVVYRARDCERKLEIALKRLRLFDIDAIHRFKYEFRNLANITHENLLQIYDLVHEGDDWFLTMELVTGCGLAAYILSGPGASTEPKFRPAGAGTAADWRTPTSELTNARNPPLGTVNTQTTVRAELGGTGPTGHPHFKAPVARCTQPEQFARLRQVFGQIVAGVHALHRQDVLHRDLKPSNVLVSPNGRAVVLDFGIAMHPSRDRRRGFAGTPAYMAPEQAKAVELTPAADWYAVGTMLFELLTGRRPFVGRAGDVLETKQRTDAKSVRSVCPDAPPDLADLCDALLARDPAGRPGVRQIELALGGELSDVSDDNWLAEASSLVGRESHLRALHDSLSACVDAPQLVFVEGSSGAGKTVLVQRFLRDVRDRGDALVFAGRCYERESVPYKAVDELVDAIAVHLSELPEPDRVSMMPAGAAALQRLFPVMSSVWSRTELDSAMVPADPHRLRRIAFRALRDLLATLAEHRPVCLHVDDVHWGDSDSAALISEVLRPPHAPRVLWVVSFRIEEAKESPFVCELQETVGATAHIEVGPLSPEDSAELVRALVPLAETPPRLDDILRLSEGNPYLIGEIARHPVSPGDETSLSKALNARFGKLTDSGRRLLEVVSVARGPIPQGVAAQAAQLSGAERGVLASLRARNLLRTNGTRARDVVETYHDRIRETIVGELDPEVERKWHARIASALIDWPEADPESIAEHLDGAGKSAQAGIHYRRAAENAEEQLAFGLAAKLYRLAIARLAPTGNEASELFARLARSLVHAGRGPEAADAFVRASSTASDANAVARYRGLAATELLRSGNIDDGTALLRSVLHDIQIDLPKSRWTALLQLLALRGRLALRGLGFERTPAEQISAQQLCKLETCWAASGAMAMINYIVGTAFQVRHLLEALKAGEPHHVARALSSEAVNQTLNGVSRERVALILQRAEDIAESLDDGAARVWAHGTRSLAEYQFGEWRVSRDESERTLAVTRTLTGLSWERGSAQLYLACAQFWLGDLATLSRCVPEELTDFESRGDLFGATNLSIGTPSVCWLVTDEPQRRQRVSDEAASRWSHRGYHLQHYWRGLGDLYGYLYEAEPAQALETANQLYRDARRAFLLRCPAIRQEMRFFRGVAALAVATDRRRTQGSELRIARRMVRGLLREKLRAPSALAVLLAAGVERARGRNEAAIVRFGAAAELLRAADMPIVSAFADRARGLLMGGEHGNELVEAANATIAGQKVANVEAFARLFV